MIRLQARKLEIKEVPYATARDFLNAYHLMGAGSCQSNRLRLGLYNNSELVQLLTFRLYNGMRFNWECARACSKKDTYIIGGLSRLMSHAAAILGGDIIFAVYPEIYAGHSMHKAGFAFSHSAGILKDHHNLGITKVNYYKWLKPRYDTALGCVYLLTFDNGKYYIGQHKGCKEVREDKQALTDGYSGGGTLLPRAKKRHKYTMEVIDLFYDQAQANYRELYWIKKYNSIEHGYNIREGFTYPMKGNSLFCRLGISRTIKEYNQKHPEKIQKQRERVKQFWQDSEKRKAMSNKKKVYHMAHPEMAQKHGKYMKQYWEKYPEERKALNEKMKRVLGSERVRKKMSESARNRWESIEIREKAREKMLQWHKAHPEAREIHSERIKELNKNPEYKKRITELVKKQFADPDKRKEMSEKLKAYYEAHPEAKEKARQKSIKHFENPEVREAARQRALKQFKSEEAKKAQSERIKAAWQDPEKRARILAAQQRGREIT